MNPLPPWFYFPLVVSIPAQVMPEKWASRIASSCESSMFVLVMHTAMMVYEMVTEFYPHKHMWILAKVRMDIWVLFFFRGTGYTKSSKYIQNLNLILPSTSHLGFKCGRGLPTYNTMPLPRTESLVIPLVQLQAPKARKVRGTCGHSFPKPPWIANQSM